MADISIKFGTPKTVSFREKGISDPLEARFFGTAEISEYDKSKYPDDDTVVQAVKSGLPDMAEEIFENWPAGDVMDSNKKKIRLDDTSNQPKLSDLTPEEHGPLIEINYHHSAHGMSMGSGTSNSDDIVWQEDGSVIIESTDHSNGTDTYEKYIAGSEAAEKLRKYVKDAHLAEMAQVGFIQSPYQMTDYSSNARLKLTFDDGRDGTQVKVTRSLNLDSYWKLQSDAVRGMFEILKECTSTGTCLEKKETPYDIFSPAGAFHGFVGMMGGTVPEPAAPEPAKPSGNAWKCPNCGAENFGKFCTECGTPKPE